MWSCEAPHLEPFNSDSLGVRRAGDRRQGWESGRCNRENAACDEL